LPEFSQGHAVIDRGPRPGTLKEMMHPHPYLYLMLEACHPLFNYCKNNKKLGPNWSQLIIDLVEIEALEP